MYNKIKALKRPEKTTSGCRDIGEALPKQTVVAQETIAKFDKYNFMELKAPV